LPINQKQTDTIFLIHNDSKLKQNTHQANSVYHTLTLAETIQFIHQCMFSPTIPNYITQDDDEANLANLLFNNCLPKIEQAVKINQADVDLHEANHMHERIFRNSLPKMNVCNTKTPLGINSQAVLHLMGTHLENKFHPAFIPNNLQQYTRANAYSTKYAMASYTL
jgi:hypothetical protein